MDEQFTNEPQGQEDILEQIISAINSKDSPSTPPISDTDASTQKSDYNFEDDPRLQYLTQLALKLKSSEHETSYKNDLAQIKAAYPDEEAQHVRELGSDFAKLRAQGIPPLIAYDALRSDSLRKSPSTPSMGDISKNTGGAKEHYTRSEVSQMSAGEVKQNFEAIRKSMNKW